MYSLWTKIICLFMLYQIYNAIDRNLGNAILYYSSHRKDVLDRYHPVETDVAVAYYRDRSPLESLFYVFASVVPLSPQSRMGFCRRKGT